MARTIKIELLDEISGITIYRDIDISNFSIHHDGTNLPGPNKQRKILEDWCEERGNDQHNTILSVQSWEII